MATEDVDEFLEHVGVKGMRWGKRKAEPVKMGPQKKAMNPATKRKIALGAALVAGAGVAVLNSNANVKKQAQGQQYAQTYMNDFASRSMWDLAANL